MEKEMFQRAFYIKLGQGGKWEDSSIKDNLLRIGWKEWSLKEINSKKWDLLKNIHRSEYKTQGTATMDVNALANIVTSTSDDIWITFHASYLWWCRLAEGQVQGDDTSRYRMVIGQWRNCDIHKNPLIVNQISGRLSKYQMFRATVCRVEGEALNDLGRIINDEQSDYFRKISAAQSSLISEVIAGIRSLHPKDFEILADLVFSKTWQRVSLVGEAMRYVDIEFRDPITGDFYQVQVKSSSSLKEFQAYANEYAEAKADFKRFYFVVHDPDKALEESQEKYDKVDLVLPQRLAQMVIEAGLVGWLLKKIK